MLLLFFCSSVLGAQSSATKWQALDDQQLLKAAASIIERLKTLNEDLKKEAAEALRESRELSSQLVALKSELAASEQAQKDLVEGWRRSEELWKSYKKEETKKSIKRALIIVGGTLIVGIIYNLNY